MEARQARSRSGETASERWDGLFYLAIASVLIAAAIGLALVAGAACGSANPQLPATTDPAGTVPTRETAAVTTTPGPPGTSSATVTAEATASATQPAATTVAQGGGTAVPPTRTPDSANVLPCGDILAAVNKKNRLAENCAPGDLVQLAAANGEQYLRAGAASAFAQLVAAAETDGFELVAVSAYRSYNSQIAAYQSNVNQFGQEYADRVSAKPGHSEHQLGTTVDVSSASAGFGLEAFAGTDEAAWVAENAHRFGFVVSYPAGKEGITGYAYEPWHLRFVGVGVAGQVKSSGRTLHEILGG